MSGSAFGDNIVAIVKDRLYFTILPDMATCPVDTKGSFHFCTDDDLIYAGYYQDFGPLSISCVVKYCNKVKSLLRSERRRLIHYTGPDRKRAVNAAFLAGTFAVVYAHASPKSINVTFTHTFGSFPHFVDASQGMADQTIRLLDCLQAMHKAVRFGFVNLEDFDTDEYDRRDRPEHGDLNWVIPRRFVAFTGPVDKDPFPSRRPDFYLRYFLDHNVRTIVRLNNKMYDAGIFRDVGLTHYDLFFPDGSTPSKSVLARFLSIVEKASGAIGVHCKAGLGRTGSLIAAYIVKHYRMTAREAIAWLRICRPGSVIGLQQDWLETVETGLWKQGSAFRDRSYCAPDKVPKHRYGIYSARWPKERARWVPSLSDAKAKRKKY